MGLLVGILVGGTVGAFVGDIVGADVGSNETKISGQLPSVISVNDYIVLLQCIETEYVRVTSQGMQIYCKKPTEIRHEQT